MALRCFENGVQAGALNAHAAGMAIPDRRVSRAAPPAPAALGTQDRASEDGSSSTVEEPMVSLGRPPAVEPDMPFNPFCNAVPGISNPYEVFKTVVMLPVCILRMLVFTVVLLVGLVLTKLALLGARDVLTKPFPAWRRALLWPVRLLARVLLFTCGFHWIKINGRPAPRDKAPILVCNHVTFVDPVFIFYMHLPVIVTAEENLRYPVMGAIISAMQVIAINRGSPDSRRIAAGEIKRRAMCNDWTPVMIFPEATTTNGKSLVSFKAGAFTPGYPVQSMLVRYPHVHMDPSWVALGPSIYFLLFRLMTQFHNHMVVDYLPVVEPTWREQCNPRLFTERVRLTMANALNVMVTEHSFEDLLLVLEAQKHKDYSGIPVVEFGKFEKLFRLSIKEAKRYYFKFRSLDPGSKGIVAYEEFIQRLALPDCHAARQVFSLFDSLDRGYFNFRQYVNGLAFISRFEKLKETIEAAYGLCDQDEDGSLSFEDVSSSLRDLIPSISKEQVGEIWSRITKEKKSTRVVGSAEFVEFLEGNPEYIAVFLYARTDLLSTRAETADGYVTINGKLFNSY